MDRLDAQVAFLREADKLKSVLRASRLIDDDRFENSAEHSWHVMLYALVLADQAGPEVRIDRVLRMLLLHDIVEIDAGDAPIHGHVDHAAMAAKEAAAAGKPEIKEVTVLQRIWHVSLSQDHPGYYKATRRNDEMLPFRGPAVLSARQAARAFRAATGCRAKADTMFRTISGNYYAKLICPSR